MKLILGSISPRRKEILSFFDLSILQVPSHFDEENVPFCGSPHDYVALLAREKARHLERSFPKEALLTADTLVYLDHKIYGKPKNRAEAFQFLMELSGKEHTVCTALHLSYRGSNFSALEETSVLFHDLTKQEIEAYLEAIPFADKAGSYMIQGAGGLIVKSIKGCYYNVMGLPLGALKTVLGKIGIDLWQHLKKEPSPPLS